MGFSIEYRYRGIEVCRSNERHFRDLPWARNLSTILKDFITKPMNSLDKNKNFVRNF